LSSAKAIAEANWRIRDSRNLLNWEAKSGRTDGDFCEQTTDILWKGQEKQVFNVQPTQAGQCPSLQVHEAQVSEPHAVH
jgi:hypothetical protein